MAAAVQLVQDPRKAATLLNPERLRLLEHLREPDSAAGLARRLKVPRQRINYHLRELERDGMLELVEERRKGNCVERLVRATARSYLLSPEILGRLAQTPEAGIDRFSASYLVAVAAKVVGDLAILGAAAQKARKRLATLTLQTEVRFRSAGDRSAFAEELANFMAQLVTRYHDEKAEGGRRFHVVVGSYPVVSKAIEELSKDNVNLE